jgi:hypothetical protein
MGNAVSLSMEVVAGIGIVVLFLIWRGRTAVKEKAIAEGVEDNGKENDQGLGFKYIL